MARGRFLGRTALIFWLLVIAATYAAFEVGVRKFAPKVTEVTDELDSALIEISKKHGDIPSYVADQKKPRENGPHLHPVLGWDREIRRHAGCPGSCEKPFRVLLMGDSVSAGHGVKAGAEDYGYLLSQLPNKRGIEVFNAAVAGYGVDQMLEKAKQVGKLVKPDLIIFSYIAHDLLRSGRNYIYLRTRPGLALREGQLVVTPPGDLAAYIQHYADYRDSYREGLWLLSFLWQNRRYYAPYLYRDFFAAAYAHVVSGMEAVAGESGAELTFVMLPQSFKFRNRDDVMALMDDTLRRLKNSSTHPFQIADIDQCVQRHLAADKLGFQVMRFHPGPSGHRAYADCLAEQVLLPALGRKTGG
jgi:hypothetical protein